MTTDNDQVKYDYIAALREDRVNNLGGGERPLSPLGNPDVISKVGKLAEFFLANAENVGELDRKFCENIKDELRWQANRFFIYEHALLGLKVGDKNNIELAQLLDGRSEVLYHLFGIQRTELSNEEILDVLKKSSDPRVTDGLYFPMTTYRSVIHYPSLIKEFLDAADKWQDDREKFNKELPEKEPEMFNFISAVDDPRTSGIRRSEPNKGDTPTRRFIRREWLDWYTFKNSGIGRGRSYEEACQAAADTLLKQLFPEGKPVDVEVRVEQYARDHAGHEVTVRRVIHNVEYF